MSDNTGNKSEELIVMRKKQSDIDGLNNLIGTYFSNRTHLVGLEIGSYQGEYTEIFLKSGKFDKLYCIDAWTNGYDDRDKASYNTDKAEAVFDRRFENESKIVKIKGFSYDVVDKIPDNSLDFLYVDATHTYNGVKKDLELYVSKVKENGVIAGHDYNKQYYSGVVRAVDEFIGGSPENIYCDDSFAIQKNNIKSKKRYQELRPCFSDVRELVPTILSLEESLDLFCNSNKTFIRIGDGELDFICGQTMIFEEKNEKLASLLHNILLNDSELIEVGIFNAFSTNLSSYQREIYFYNYYSKVIKQYMLFMASKNKNLFSLKRKYFEGRMFFPYHCCDLCKISTENVFGRIKNVFKDKSVLLVTGDPYFRNYKENENVFNEASSLDIYETPSKGSFAHYDEFLNDLRNEKDKLICMACGPCGKVLAYELQTQYGIRCIDTGHLMRDYQRFVNKIVPFSPEDRMYVD